MIKENNERVITRKRITTYIDIGLLTTLNDLSIDTRLQKSVLIDEALELLFDKYKIEYTKKIDIERLS